MAAVRTRAPSAIICAACCSADHLLKSRNVCPVAALKHRMARVLDHLESRALDLPRHLALRCDVVGFGGWQNFKFLFAGRNLAGQDRIYAVDKDGRLLSYGDAGTPGNVSDPDVVGFGGWQVFKFLFAGRDAAGHDRIYAVDQNGQLLAYGDSGGPGNVSNPMIVGFGGWRDFKFVFSGQGRIYAVTA